MSKARRAASYLGFVAASALLFSFVIAPEKAPSQISNPGVQQSGAVTKGHVATWLSSGVIQDGGAAAGTVTAITCSTALTCSPNPIVGAGTILLADTAITPGAYPSSAAKVPTFTADAQGRLTAAGSQDYTGTVVLAAGNFANPSASIGLAAVNGSATTAMRSDGAPALSQAITPAWTGAHQWANAPAYNLASNTLAVSQIFPLDNAAQTVAAGKQFNYLRLTPLAGTDATFTVGAAGLAEGIYSSLTLGSGSDATAVGYGGVMQITNAGPGTAKGIHTGCFGSGTSAGVCIGVNSQVQPVSTQGYMSAYFSSLTSTGVHDKAIGLGIESSNGDRYLLGVGNSVAALPIGTAYYRAWMATGSSTNARAFQTLDNSGAEIQYISKTGVYAAPAGTAGAPAYTFLGDTNNGFYSPAADIVDYAASGTLQIRFSGAAAKIQVGSTSFGALGETIGATNGIAIGDPSEVNPQFLLGNFGSSLNIIGGHSNHTVEVRANNLPVLDFLPARHLAPQTAGAPALTSCGTSPAISGTDVAGEVTMGTTATGCVITFNVTYAAAPYCTVTDQSQLTSFAYTVAADKITVTQTSTSNNKLNYMCMARVGG